MAPVYPEGECFLAGQRVIPGGQDSAIWLTCVANHSTGYDSPYPFEELAI